MTIATPRGNDAGARGLSGRHSDSRWVTTGAGRNSDLSVQTIRLLNSFAVNLCAFRRVRRSTTTAAFTDRRRRTRQNAATIRGGTPDLTSGCADADHAGARPYLHRCAGTRSRDATHVQRRRRERILTCAGRQSGPVLIIFPVAY
jgi:hypothetical protein